jgi:hypothetical protein
MRFLYTIFSWESASRSKLFINFRHPIGASSNLPRNSACEEAVFGQRGSPMERNSAACPPRP